MGLRDWIVKRLLAAGRMRGSSIVLRVVWMLHITSLRAPCIVGSRFLTKKSSAEVAQDLQEEGYKRCRLA